MSNLTVEARVVLLQIRLLFAEPLVPLLYCTDDTVFQEGSLYMYVHEVQLMDSKSAELERLLSQLSDVNDSMRNALGGRNDTRAHTLTRHRDILHDYQQVTHIVLLCIAYRRLLLRKRIDQLADMTMVAHVILVMHGNGTTTACSCVSSLFMWQLHTRVFSPFAHSFCIAGI